jgi:serine/threonine protein kinase
MITSLQSGKYRIESIVGSGGFGNTYLAEQVTLGRKVAIKEFYMKEFCERDDNTSQVIIPTEGSRQIVDKYRQKFLKEAQVIASLKNEHIIQIHDIFEENDTAYYVMEYVDGGSLKDKVESEGPLSEAEALTYLCQVGEALSYLHSNNILHLDVKPANILLDKSNRAILIDFGISKHYDEGGGQTSTTPAGISKGYAPLEQYKQDAITQFNPSTDVYSLGASLYFLLTGKNPPDATDIYEDGLPAMPGTITEATRQAILAAMQPRRKDRPQTVSEFIKFFNNPDLQAKPDIRREGDSGREDVIESAEDTVIVNTNSLSLNISNETLGSDGSVQNIEKPHVKSNEETVIISNEINISSQEDSHVKDSQETGSKDNEEKKPKSKLGVLIGIVALIILAIIFILPNSESNNAENVAITTQGNKVKTPKLVDMGVSVLWADRNVGASEVYDYGINYNWGITDISGNSKQSSDFNPTGKSIAGTGDDIASVNYGNGWRMPSWDEYIELMQNCDLYSYSENGVSGILLVSKVNSNKLFFPNYKRNQAFAGTENSVFSSDVLPYYWTASCQQGSGFVFSFRDYKCAYNHNFRLPIRAVKAK